MEAEMRATGQKIQARLLEGGTVISEQDVPLTRVPTGDLLCGVLSRSGPSFDFLPTLELPPPLRRARIAHIEVEDLATRPQVLASLDCLIFDNIATSTMLDSQRAALTSWVYSGGLMVVDWRVDLAEDARRAAGRPVAGQGERPRQPGEPRSAHRHWRRADQGRWPVARLAGDRSPMATGRWSRTACR